MPKQVDVAVQRLSIANAAIQVIDDAGLEGARLRDVARAARVTTGAVTHYFDNKDAVLEAALAEIVRRTLTRMGASPKRVPSSDVRSFISGVCTYLPLDAESRQEWRVWLAFWGRAMSNAHFRDVHRAHYATIVDRLAELLRALVIKPPGVKALRACADAVVAAIDGVGTRATLEPDLWPAKRQRDTVIALLTPMLSAFVGGGPRA